MQFERIQDLWFLAGIPLLLLLFYIYAAWRRRSVRRLGDPALVQRLMDRFSLSRKFWKLALALTAFAFFVLGAANLRMGTKKEKVQNAGSEVMICFDVSRSMLAEDVKPDRLTQARITCSQLIEKLAGNKIGLVVFAGKSFVQMPLTVDSRAALMYLNTVNTDMISQQGTAIGDALETAIKAFENGGEEVKDIGRTIIIISDGESHDADAMDMAKEAASKNIKIITLGVGSSGGAPIPQQPGNPLYGYKHDRQGNIVLSKLNEQMMRDMADAGDGIYRNVAEGRKAIQDSVDIVNRQEKQEGKEYTFSEYANHFQIFLGAGLFLLTLEFFMSDKRPRWVQKMQLFKTAEKRQQ